MDKISLCGLKIKCRIGVYPWEQKILQTLIFNLSYACNVSQLAKEDNIAYAVDYVAINKAIEKHVQENHFQLIETLAAKLADMLLQQFDLHWLQLQIKKPAVMSNLDYVMVEVERQRET